MTSMNHQKKRTEPKSRRTVNKASAKSEVPKAKLVITEQPLSSFYKDEGGRGNTLSVRFKLEGQIPEGLAKMVANGEKIPITTSIYFENGVPANSTDQRFMIRTIGNIDNQTPNDYKPMFNCQTRYGDVKWRYLVVSKKRDGRKCKLKISIPFVEPTFTTLTYVLSKRRKDSISSTAKNEPAKTPEPSMAKTEESTTNKGSNTLKNFGESKTESESKHDETSTKGHIKENGNIKTFSHNTRNEVPVTKQKQESNFVDKPVKISLENININDNGIIKNTRMDLSPVSSSSSKRKREGNVQLEEFLKFKTDMTAELDRLRSREIQLQKRVRYLETTLSSIKGPCDYSYATAAFKDDDEKIETNIYNQMVGESTDFYSDGDKINQPQTSIEKISSPIQDGVDTKQSDFLVDYDGTTEFEINNKNNPVKPLNLNKELSFSILNSLLR